MLQNKISVKHRQDVPLISHAPAPAQLNYFVAGFSITSISVTLLVTFWQSLFVKILLVKKDLRIFPFFSFSPISNF